MRRAVKSRNPVARAVRRLRPQVKPSGKIYRRRLYNQRGRYDHRPN